jgi:hypothetical protein
MLTRGGMCKWRGGRCCSVLSIDVEGDKRQACVAASCQVRTHRPYHRSIHHVLRHVWRTCRKPSNCQLNQCTQP